MNRTKLALTNRIDKYLTNFNPDDHQFGKLQQFFGVDVAEKKLRETSLASEPYFEAALAKAKKRVEYKNKQREEAKARLAKAVA